MIVRDRPSGFKLFLVLRGSILHRILPSLVFNVLLATLVTISHGDLFALKITLTPIPFSLLGLPLAIFLGFRNTAAYDRYWEARKLWGNLLIRARNLTRQCQNLISGPQPVQASLGLDDVRVRMIYRTIAFAYALKQQLRPEMPQADLSRWLQPAELWQLDRTSNPSTALLLAMGMDLRLCLEAKRINPCLAANLDDTISAMTADAAACERIKNTPIPFSYTLLLHRTAYLYCFLLPFGLVHEIGFMTPFVVGIVAYTFFGLDALGDEIEEPFGNEPNDLPLEAICRTIDIELREALADEHVPQPLQPVDYCVM